jgi:outer membrane protein TolC
LIVGASVSPCRGEATAVETLRTLDDYVDYAVARNPRVAGARAGADAAGEVSAQVGALPDPELGFGYYIETPETRVGPMQYTVTLSQKLPFFGKRSMSGDIAGLDSEIAVTRYQRALIDLVYGVRNAYYEYFRLHGVGRVLDEERAILERMEDAAQVKYASGLVGQQDVLKAQLELSRVEDELTVNRRDLVSVTARLTALLNLHPSTRLAPPEVADPGALRDSVALDAGALYEAAVRRRPELNAAAFAEEKTAKATALAKREYYPDVMVGVQYVNVGKRDGVDVPDNGKDIWQVAAGINVPIWFGKRGAGAREAEARQAWARNERTSAELRLRSEITDAIGRVEAAGERADLYESVILPQAEQAFLASDAGYQTGKVDFLDYLDSQRMLLSVRKKHLGVIADQGKQRAYLDRVLGVDIEYAEEGQKP